MRPFPGGVGQPTGRFIDSKEGFLMAASDDVEVKVGGGKAKAGKKTSTGKAPAKVAVPKKPAAKKPAVKKAVAGKAVEKKAAKAPAKKASTRTVAAPVAKAASVAPITPDRRRAMIAEAAYYRAEQRGFSGGDEAADWLAAEAEIDGRIGRG